MNKLKIAVLFGGYSTEYDISLQSAYSVITHLDRSKYNPVLLGITPSGEWFHFSGELVKIRENTWYNPADCVRAIISPSREVHGVLKFEAGEVCTIRLDAAMPVLHGKTARMVRFKVYWNLPVYPLSAATLFVPRSAWTKTRRIKSLMWPVSEYLALSFLKTKWMRERFGSKRKISAIPYLSSPLEPAHPLELPKF